MTDSEGKSILCTGCGKVCYTVREAGEILNSLKRHRYRGHGRKEECPKRKYYCSICGYYHLTHLPVFSCRKEDTVYRNGKEVFSIKRYEENNKRA